MEEKIKIHLTKKVYDTLLKDCEAFEFLKKDNISLNKNAFLITLINNYYLTYYENEQKLFDLIKNTIKEETSFNKIDDISKKIVSKLNKISSIPSNDKLSCIINLKPTKDSLTSLSYIEKYLLKDYSMSEFFRNLFSSYASLPQDEREKIIFKSQYETITEAINKGKKIFFTTITGGRSTHESEPYALCNSKEELHYYLLTKYKNSCQTFRLSRIQNVIIINEDVSFIEEDIKMFEKMIKYGPQFKYEPSDETVIIKLTNKGKLMFRTHYTHRPIPDYIEGDYYYFNCSYAQIYAYFRRFGMEAYIVSPSSLRDKLYKFHKQAVNHYSENARKNRH